MALTCGRFMGIDPAGSHRNKLSSFSSGLKAIRNFYTKNDHFPAHCKLGNELDKNRKSLIQSGLQNFLF